MYGTCMIRLLIRLFKRDYKMAKHFHNLRPHFSNWLCTESVAAPTVTTKTSLKTVIIFEMLFYSNQTSMEGLLLFNSEKPLNTEIYIQICHKNSGIPGLHRILKPLNFLTSWRISRLSINDFSVLVYTVPVRCSLIIFCKMEATFSSTENTGWIEKNLRWRYSQLPLNLQADFRIDFQYNVIHIRQDYFIDQKWPLFHSWWEHTAWKAQTWRERSLSRAHNPLKSTSVY